MDGRPAQETSERRRRLGTGVWVWYLAIGAVLAVTCVAMFVWVAHHQANEIYTETNTFIAQWLYPEKLVSIFWKSLSGFEHKKYYMAWCSLFTVGSFVMAAPILLVGWLRHRRTT